MFFGKGIKLFRLFGFEIRLDPSWIIIAALVTWTLAAGFFPHFHPGLEPAAYWLMGVFGALGLFASIILHECAHSVVARWYGIPIKGITLFIFGGVAEMEREPPSPKSEFFMAIAGPIMSALLVGVFWASALAGRALDGPITITAVLGYLAWINGVVVIFNMVPAFPLDGGRVLRSLLWAWKNNLKWATRIASLCGTGFGWILIGFGVLNFISGNLLGGFWYVLIGLFLRGASRSACRQLVLREVLEGEPVCRFMESHPIPVPSSTSVQQFLDGFVRRYQHTMFPVVDEGKLLGLITLNQVRAVPSEERSIRTVAELLVPRSQQNTVGPRTNAVDALQLMNRTRASRLLIADGEHLEGILSLRDLQRFLSFKIDLEEARA